MAPKVWTFPAPTCCPRPFGSSPPNFSSHLLHSTCPWSHRWPLGDLPSLPHPELWAGGRRRVRSPSPPPWSQSRSWGWDWVRVGIVTSCFPLARAPQLPLCSLCPHPLLSLGPPTPVPPGPIGSPSSLAPCGPYYPFLPPLVLEATQSRHPTYGSSVCCLQPCSPSGSHRLGGCCCGTLPPCAPLCLACRCLPPPVA